MVHDAADVPAGPASLDSVRVGFDEPRLVSDAGLLVTATLARAAGDRGAGQRVGVAGVPDAGRGAARAQGDVAGARDARRRGQHR